MIRRLRIWYCMNFGLDRMAILLWALQCITGVNCLLMGNAGNSSDAGVSSYRDGYSDCAREVATYLGRLDSPGGVLVRTRVLAHLSARLRAVNSAHRRQQAPPTFHRLPVAASTADDRCRVTTSFRPAASSTSDSRVVAPAATGTCLADVKFHSLDGAAACSDAVRRPTTPPDEKHHVTTTVTSPTCDVNGNDVTTHVGDYQRLTPADEELNSSIVWRPWWSTDIHWPYRSLIYLTKSYRRNCYVLLTPSTIAVPNCCCSKGSAPYWSNPPFLIFDIRALWRSVLSARAPECQKLKMVG